MWWSDLHSSDLFHLCIINTRGYLFISKPLNWFIEHWIAGKRKYNWESMYLKACMRYMHAKIKLCCLHACLSSFWVGKPRLLIFQYVKCLIFFSCCCYFKNKFYSLLFSLFYTNYCSSFILNSQVMMGCMSCFYFIFSSSFKHGHISIVHLDMTYLCVSFQHVLI